MSNTKLKYSLTEANNVIKKLVPKLKEARLIQKVKLAYQIEFEIGNTAMWNYCKGNVPSPVAADHLARYIEDYCTENNIAA